MTWIPYPVLGRLVALLCSFLYFAEPVAAQVIQGQVVDADQGKPVAGASVFVSGSTYGAICDVQGSFVLSSHPPLPFELTITAVGYESSVLKLDREYTGASLPVRLKARPVAIAEVTVRLPLKDGWARYGKDFLEAFIGYSDFAGQCKLLNKEALSFYYDNDSHVLQVVADAPLKIRNEATGYLITYWLDDYTFDYISRKLFFRGYSLFEPLAGRKEKKLAKWVHNRQTAYRGSLYHFMRSLYRDSLLAEGFEVRKLKRVPVAESGRYLPRQTDTLLFREAAHLTGLATRILGAGADMPKAMAFMKKLREWRADSSAAPLRVAGIPGADTTLQQEYRFLRLTGDSSFVVQHFEYPAGAAPPAAAAVDASPTPVLPKGNVSFSTDASGNRTKLSPDKGKAGAQPDSGTQALMQQMVQRQRERPGAMIEVLFTGLVPADSFRNEGADGTVQCYFTDCLQVTYTREYAEAPYYSKLKPQEREENAFQQSLIRLLQEVPLTLTPQGNFYESYNLFVERYWAYEKLDKLLPLDYEP